MKSKSITGILTTAAILSSGSLIAKEAPALLMKGGSVETVFLTSANKTLIEFKKNAKAVDKVRKKMSDYDSIYIMEPKEFVDAMELYMSRDYKGAKEALKVVQGEYKSFTGIPGNYAILATFYEMECERKLGNLDALEAIRSKFIPDALLRESHKKQLELYSTVWDAVRKEEWPRILELSKSLEGQKLTNSQRAQVAYGVGLAYEKTGKVKEALDSYNDALVSDFGASEAVCQKAILGAIRVIKAQQGAEKAIKAGPDSIKAGSPLSQSLAEGAALVTLWDMSIGGGKPIPNGIELKKFAVERPKPAPAPVAEKAEEAAPAEKAAPKPAPKPDKKPNKKPSKKKK